MTKILLFCLFFLVALPLFSDSPDIRPIRLAGGVCYKNIPYVSGGGVRQQLDLYLPPQTVESPVPVIVWIHWGSWNSGNKNEFCLPVFHGYVQKGYAVAAVNYRLLGMAPFPAQVEDCKSALRWLRAHAEDFGLDSDRFGIWGVSAGGHLAALTALADKTAGFDVGEHLDQASEVRCVCDFFGPSDLTSLLDDPQFTNHIQHEADVFQQFLEGPLEERLATGRRASPIHYVTKNSPPFLMLHGEDDKVVPVSQSRMLHEKLQKAGAKSELIFVPKSGHDLGGVMALAQFQKINDFFDQHLKGTAKMPLTSGGL